MLKIILASKSPRRKELLEQMGLKFSVRSKDVPELFTGETPEESVSELALKKALAVAKDLTNGLVIGADTVVVLEDRVLGKPESPLHAQEMLLALSGKKHQVLTGVAVVDVASGNYLCNWEMTDVFFRHLTNHTIESYVESKEPMDKAGAYGIQGKGGLLVSRIEGCYFNVVGLPIGKLAEMLEEFKIKVF